MQNPSFYLPCLLSVSVLSACSGTVDTNGGTGATAGTGGTTTSSDTGATAGSGGTTSGGLPACPIQLITGGACLKPNGGFATDPPATLEIVGTVTEIGDGEPPLTCWSSAARFLATGAPAVWARVLESSQQEWVVAFSVPSLEPGFNGHVAVNDTVQISMSWASDVGGLGVEYVIGDLALSRDGALVAYASENKAPAWYTKGDAVCHSQEGCCGETGYEAQAQVNGASSTVPIGETVDVGGLAISHLGWRDMEDLGCCNFAVSEPIGVSAAALP